MENQDSYQKASSWIKGHKELILAVILLALWLIGYRATFNAELKGVKNFKLYTSMTSEQKRLAYDGVAYILAKEAMAVAPEDSSIYFINIADFPLSVWLSIKVRYHLYPRKIVEVESEDKVNIEEALGAGTIMLFVQHGKKLSSATREVIHTPSFKVIRLSHSEKGLFAVIAARKEKN